MGFGFVVVQSDISCAPQHTKWLPLKNWMCLRTRYIFGRFSQVLRFVVLQLDISCAPQHTKWRPIKNWLYLSTRYTVWLLFSAPSVCYFAVGHYLCSSAYKMATCKYLTVFEHTVCRLVAVLSSFGLLFYSRTLRVLLSIENGDL